MSELRFEKIKIIGAELGEESCVPDLLGEHILQNSLKFRLDEKDEIYEGYGRRKNAYPYRQYNNYTREVKERVCEAAVLENRFLKAVFLPEYGGRLWELWDKKTEKNLLYTNDVIRFSNLAVRNAWFSGGVEWNIGVIGHTPYTTDPLYTAVTKTESGAPVLRMYEYERIRKVPYQMDFWLDEEDCFLNCRMRIVNESEDVIPMYWWSNIAVPEYEGGHIVVPAKQAFTNRDNEVFKVDIPVVEGIDITDYKKIPKSVDYFFDLEKEKPKYIANLDKNGYGLLHRSTGRLRSRKLFSWGNQQASDHWQEFLTESAGRYIEIQAGLAKTQYGCIPMAPHTAWEWIEQYGPVKIDESKADFSKMEEQLTGLLVSQKAPKKLEDLLEETEQMAKTKAELLIKGSSYGVLKQHGNLAEHLEYVLEKDTLKKWKNFFETGKLHEPETEEAPDEFLIDAENLGFLQDTLKRENQDNWYAFYQAGIGAFAVEDFPCAGHYLLRSWERKHNPWACHGLACVCLLSDREEEAADWMEKGLNIENRRVSYLKEALKILGLCKEYGRLIRWYENLDKNTREIGKLKYYYIHALHKTGEDKKAYELLEENGGLVIDDIREGEDSVASLWSELYENLFGVKKSVPYRYDFKAF